MSISHKLTCERADKDYPYLSKKLKYDLAFKLKVPVLTFEKEGENAYTDGGNKIVVGLKMPLFEKVKDIEDVDTLLLYLVGHETQHCLSTTDKAWMWGIKTGARVIAEELSKLIEDTPRIIPNDHALDKFCKDKDIQDKGYYISRDFLEYISHFVQNSLEDGRIERIRSSKSFFFKKAMIYWRGIFRASANADTSQDDNPDIAAFYKILNEILMLATTGCNTSGFFKESDQSIIDFVDSLRLEIAAGVYSPNCKTCMGHAVDIERQIAPYMIPVIKQAKKEKELFDKIMDALKKAIESTGSDSDLGNTGLSDFDEQTDDDDESNEIYSKLSKKISDKSGDKPDKKSDDKSDGKSDDKSDGESGDKSDSESNDKSGGKPCSESDPSDSDEGEDAELDNVLNKIHAYALKGNESPEDAEEKIEAAMKKAAEEKKGISEAVSGVSDNKMPSKKKEEKKDINTTEDYGKEGKVTFTERVRVYDLTERLPGNLSSRVKRLRGEVRKLFNKENTPSYRGMRSGKLDTNNAWQILGGRSDVFIKSSPSVKKTRAIYLLCDNSGSMGYGAESKRYYACCSLAVLEECFKKEVPLKIAAFDASGYDAVSHELIKDWNENSRSNFSYNFCVKGRGGWGNKDGFSIRKAAEDLLKRPEKEKLLVILSDGAPTDYAGGSSAGEKDVEAAVEEIRSKGIEVASIYFSDYKDTVEENAFRRMYKRNLVMTTPEKIEAELFKVIKKFCFK